MKLIICILGLAAVALAGDNELSALLKQSNDKFTAQMFHEVTKANVGQSVVLSAFSVLHPLAQLTLASVGPSHDELLKAVGLPDDDTTKAVFSNVNTELRSVKGVELNMASRVYIANDAALNQNFAVLSRDVFNSDVKNVDFSQQQKTASEINAWVEDKTNQKIKNLVDPNSIDGTTRAVLVNAIYFKGSWMKKFNNKLTVDRDFHVSQNKTIEVPTMSARGDFLYGESAELDAKLLELPYEGGESSFLVVLPNKIDGITSLEEKLRDASQLEKAKKTMSTFEVDVMLPKFKIETTTDLKDVLVKMNVIKVFGQEANLTNLLQNESDLFISSATQKAFIEVNEDGAEAAAANVFTMSRSAKVLPPKIRKSFDADHPFYFVLKHKSNTLFNGVFIS